MWIMRLIDIMPVINIETILQSIISYQLSWLILDVHLYNSWGIKSDKSQLPVVCQNTGRLVDPAAVLGRREHGQQLLLVLELEASLLHLMGPDHMTEVVPGQEVIQRPIAEHVAGATSVIRNKAVITIFAFLIWVGADLGFSHWQRVIPKNFPDQGLICLWD